MKRAVLAALLLTAVRLHANCRATAPPSQYSIAFTGPDCTSSAPCVQGSSIRFAVVPANGCYIPFFPGPCPPPYVIDACDTLTWDFSDGTAPVSVSGSGAVDHVFARAGNLPIYVTIANAGGSTTIHGSAYVCAAPPTYVHFAKARYDVSETAGTVTVTIERSGDTSRPFTIDYITAAGAEYVRNLEVINAPISFAAGETTRQVVHRIADDHVFLGDFAHSVGILTDGDAVMDGGPAETTIINIADDEPGPELTIDDVTVPEGNGDHLIDVPLHLSSPAGDYVYAWCVPHAGTARVNVDFAPYGSTAAFDPGQTAAKCQIRILGNSIPENDKTLTISTDPVLGPAKVVRGNALVTLTNDDAATPPDPPKPPPVPPALRLSFDAPSFRMVAGTNASIALDANAAVAAALSSSDPTVVDVSPTAAVPGMVKLLALKPGTAVITATSGDATATLVVDVTPAPRRRAAR